MILQNIGVYIRSSASACAPFHFYTTKYHIANAPTIYYYAYSQWLFVVSAAAAFADITFRMLSAAMLIRYRDAWYAGRSRGPAKLALMLSMMTLLCFDIFSGAFTG